jgi:hypothetical protein
MRSRKYRVVTTLERANNRLIRGALRAGVAPRERGTEEAGRGKLTRAPGRTHQVWHYAAGTWGGY